MSNITYVLDASVLLADSKAMDKFAEHDVVIPLVAIANLDAKLDDLELGGLAARALRRLEELRVEHGGLVDPIPTPGGGTVRVELNHQDRSSLPEVLRSDRTDHRVLAVAAHLAKTDGADVRVVSKDLPLRLKAGTVGITAEEYRNEQAGAMWAGIETRHVDSAIIDTLYDSDHCQEPELGLDQLIPINSGVILKAGSASVITRKHLDGHIRRCRTDINLFGLHPKSGEQIVAADLLADQDVGIVSLGGKAGTGKSILAVAAGLEAVMEHRLYEKVIVFRPMHAVGGQDLGYLPGNEDEKMGPWAAATYDALKALTPGEGGKNVIAEINEQGLLEVLPLTHIRGRTLSNAFVIIDEAQNLERATLLTALSRLGADARVVLTHDIAQRDNIRVGRYDGIAAIIDQLKGQRLFGHVTLTKSERSPIAELVTTLLD